MLLLLRRHGHPLLPARSTHPLPSPPLVQRSSRQATVRRIRPAGAASRTRTDQHHESLPKSIGSLPCLQLLQGRKIGGPSVEVTEESHGASQEAKRLAVEEMSQGDEETLTACVHRRRFQGLLPSGEWSQGEGAAGSRACLPRCSTSPPSSPLVAQVPSMDKESRMTTRTQPHARADDIDLGCEVAPPDMQQDAD